MLRVIAVKAACRLVMDRTDAPLQFCRMVRMRCDAQPNDYIAHIIFRSQEHVRFLYLQRD
jgi:hypothetical protein